MRVRRRKDGAEKEVPRLYEVDRHEDRRETSEDRAEQCPGGRIADVCVVDGDGIITWEIICRAAGGGHGHSPREIAVHQDRLSVVVAGARGRVYALLLSCTPSGCDACPLRTDV